jgi:hypothetical protein
LVGLLIWDPWGSHHPLHPSFGHCPYLDFWLKYCLLAFLSFPLSTHISSFAYKYILASALASPILQMPSQLFMSWENACDVMLGEKRKESRRYKIAYLQYSVKPQM